jgi:ribokinase
VHLSGFPVEVVDTTAAGDAFIGGLAVALLEGMPLVEAARFANAAGALACTRLGAQTSLPARHEVMALLG